MPDESLAAKVREKLASGSLPPREELKTWAGYGTGDLCCACDVPILPAQVEYELDMPDGERFKMHAGCHGLWVAELLRRGWRARPGGDGDRRPA